MRMGDCPGVLGWGTSPITVKVLIANFGTANWAWKGCLERPGIAAMDDVRVHPFWQRGELEGYVTEAQRVLLSRTGGTPTRGVATRWYNVITIVTETVGDLWIHREKDEVWWTYSLEGPAAFEVVRDPDLRSGQAQIFLYHKPCRPWSQKTKQSGDLLWAAIHPKAREFLFTEGTCQQLAPDNALYAQALINGDDLSPWHARPDWRAREDRSGKGAVKVFNPVERSAVAMAENAWAAAMQSGQVSLSTSKNKQFGFQTKRELEIYLVRLMESQEGLCALTDLKMSHHGSDGDRDFYCSLDRIDSSGHYERGNLQVVCRFANRWKGASDNTAFKSLILRIRAEGLNIGL
jgi:hypothetical protein